MSAVGGQRPLRMLAAVGGRTLAMALILAACTGQSNDPAEDEGAGSDRPAPSEEGAPHLADISGRLAVLGVEDELFLIDPDGTDRVDIVGVDSSILERSPPTWSPDGSSVAFTEKSHGDGVHLVIATADGEVERRTEVPFMAGYVAWSPAGDRVALMGNDDEGALRLHLIEPDGGGSDVAQGAPLYLDWQPDGSAIVVNVDDRLLAITVDGPTTEIETDGEFRVPLHVDQGLLYGVDAGIGDVLVLDDGSADRPRGLLRFAPPAAYVAAPDGRRIAVLARGARESAAVVEFDDPLLSTLVPSRLEIMDLADGRLTTVTEGPLIAWFWSPDGRLLLFSESVVEGGQTLVRWSTYQREVDPDDDATATDPITVYSPFRPSSRYARGYLAFFDQMARSATFWSPDSAAFVYAGGVPPPDTVAIALGNRPASGDANGLDPTEAEDGPISGIWVQRLGDFEPVRVADGQVAVWSPR